MNQPNKTTAATNHAREVWKKRTGRSGPESRLLKAAAEYLDREGWQALVVNVRRIKADGSGTHELVIGFTGRKKP